MFAFLEREADVYSAASDPVDHFLEPIVLAPAWMWLCYGSFRLTV